MKSGRRDKLSRYQNEQKALILIDIVNSVALGIGHSGFGCYDKPSFIRKEDLF